MRLLDSHAHLDSSRFDGDRDAMLARAAAAGVEAIVTCGADVASSAAAIALAAAHATVWAACGIHPHEAQHAWATREAAHGEAAVSDHLRRLVRSPRVVAIGEIGLDYHYDFSPRPVQRAVFERQLALAAELGMPVILHNREADADLRAIVDGAGPLQGVLHCFLADRAMAEWALDRGLYLGVAGPITFRRSESLREVVRDVPLDRLLIETDSPYLAPVPLRGRRNEPAFVAHVAEGLAALWGLAPAEVAQRTNANARRLFGIP
ncbi:MAG TPA: TatD family hydrolase [Chloroflexi bacterium]|nr:TatD family hydrolase [Chloroflexota bacterium]